MCEYGTAVDCQLGTSSHMTGHMDNLFEIDWLYEPILFCGIGSRNTRSRKRKCTTAGERRLTVYPTWRAIRQRID